MRIQHNIMAMNAYRNYNTNTSALSKNLEKLSSGYKINRAGDDAAGLAISEKMRAQITGLNAAQKNVKDGISLVKTAEGAMQEIQDMLNRMDYLATQSANGTYDSEIDRMNLNKEMDALKDEIDRISKSANFNGIKLLDGSLADGTVAVEASYGELQNETNISVLTTGSCYQVHEAGKDAVAAKFDVDLKQALEGVKATTAMAVGDSFTVKVSVGGATVGVTMTLKTAVATGGVINFNNVTVGAPTAASISLTSGTASASFSVRVTGGVMKFELKASAAKVDFDTNMSVTITAASGMTLGSANGSGAVSYNCTTQNQTNGVAQVGTQLAHAHFDLDAISSSLAVKNGVLQIGEQQMLFDVDSKTTTQNKVGIAATWKEIFDRYLDTSEFQEIEKGTKPSARECIERIKAAGGRASLAHPYQIVLNGESLEQLIARLKGYGLDAIECFYPIHTVAQTAEYIELKRKYELYATGGSDFHGEKSKPDHLLAAWELGLDWLLG